MAVTAHVLPNWIKVLGQKPANSPDMDTDTFGVGLCTGSSATWSGTAWTNVFVADILTAFTEVVTGGGYTATYAGRPVLTTVTFAIGSANNIYNWTCTSPAPISFGAATTITARTMFIFDKTANTATTDANAWVASTIDFGANVISSGGAFTYTVDAVNGLAFFTAS
jgi:hypothetical protein